MEKCSVISKECSWLIVSIACSEERLKTCVLSVEFKVIEKVPAMSRKSTLLKLIIKVVFPPPLSV